jgi:hypothetical protein
VAGDFTFTARQVILLFRLKQLRRHLTSRSHLRLDNYICKACLDNGRQWANRIYQQSFQVRVGSKLIVMSRGGTVTSRTMSSSSRQTNGELRIDGLTNTTDVGWESAANYYI